MRPSGQMLVHVGLGASVVLNLMLGSVLVLRPERPQPSPQHMLARIESTLSAPDRAVFQVSMQPLAPDIARFLTALRKGGLRLQELLRRQPFDADGMRAELAQGRQIWGGFSTHFDESLVRAMAAISPEGRRRIADDMPPPPDAPGDQP